MQKAVSLIHNQQVMRGMDHIPDGDKAPTVILLHGFTGSKLDPIAFS